MGSMWEVLGREYGGMGEGGEGIPILTKGILRSLISMCDFLFLLPESYVFVIRVIIKSYARVRNNVHLIRVIRYVYLLTPKIKQ